MTKLVATERDLIQSFKDYVTVEEAHVAHLKSCLQLVESFPRDFPEDLEKYISNPLTAYKLVRRLKSEWMMVEKVTKLSPAPEFLDSLSVKFQQIPSDEDLDGVALGLVRLQETYRLQPKNILEGGLMELGTMETLSPDEAFHVATVAHKNLKFHYAFLWVQEALKQLEEGSVARVTKKEVINFLAPFSFQMGDLAQAIDLTEQLLKLDPNDFNAANHLKFYKHMKESIQRNRTETPDSGAHIYVPSFPTEQQSYEALCRGEGIKMTPRRQRALFCRYSTGGGNPRLIYAPIKEEDEWDQPQITRYHNFISDKEIDAIKRLSRPKLARAKVLDHITGRNFSAEIRVSKSTWLTEDEDPVVSHVNKRIADVTGLDMQMAEELQVANYGIGGQYEPHYDSKLANNSELEAVGGRIATTLIYMSDVNMGGATVFPTIGAALQPKKGSAVVWYNLLQNGQEDQRTLHAACPVLVGNKWVSNKWIRARGQEFRRRCALSESE
ncbi:prolyl 4-hydroxylase subunit alpha-2 [Megalops cyprinoides]|uniref:prolyl 4-hydroxylase subunit alpha-2 n=1 Tax=Megalops cyprinoides TaxID=118141 RepID=UPI001863A95B|nr:prolyl 4-hydroxylase subunit alpha-2 [Megalops cyprinoides]